MIFIKKYERGFSFFNAFLIVFSLIVSSLFVFKPLPVKADALTVTVDTLESFLGKAVSVMPRGGLFCTSFPGMPSMYEQSQIYVAKAQAKATAIQKAKIQAVADKVQASCVSGTSYTLTDSDISDCSTFIGPVISSYMENANQATTYPRADPFSSSSDRVIWNYGGLDANTIKFWEGMKTKSYPFRLVWNTKNTFADSSSLCSDVSTSDFHYPSTTVHIDFSINVGGHWYIYTIDNTLRHNFSFGGKLNDGFGTIAKSSTGTVRNSWGQDGSLTSSNSVELILPSPSISSNFSSCINRDVNAIKDWDFNLTGSGIMSYDPTITSGVGTVAFPSGLTFPKDWDNTKPVVLPTGTGAVSIPVDVPAVPTATTNTGSTTSDSTKTDTGLWSTLWGWLQDILNAIKSIPTAISNTWTSLVGWLSDILNGIKAIPTNIENWFTVDWSAVNASMDYTSVWQKHFKPFYDITNALTNISSNPQNSGGKFYMIIPKAMSGDGVTPVCVLDYTVSGVFVTWGRTFLNYAIWLAFGWWIIEQFKPKLDIN